MSNGVPYNHRMCRVSHLHQQPPNIAPSACKPAATKAFKWLHSFDWENFNFVAVSVLNNIIAVVKQINKAIALYKFENVHIHFLNLYLISIIFYLYTYICHLIYTKYNHRFLCNVKTNYRSSSYCI